jgi:hypothetical protein
MIDTRGGVVVIYHQISTDRSLSSYSSQTLPSLLYMTVVLLPRSTELPKDAESAVRRPPTVTEVRPDPWFQANTPSTIST